MNDSLKARELLLAYLLGELPEEERSAIEERMLAEQSFSDELQEAEFDLIEDYRAGRLSHGERRRVEAALSPERLRQGFAVSGRRDGRVSRSAPRSWGRSFVVGWALAAAVGVVCAAGVGLVVWHQRAARESEAQVARVVAPTVARQPGAAVTTDEVSTLSLSADTTRGGGGPTLLLLPSTRVVVVECAVPASGAGDRFLLSVADGRRVVTKAAQDGDVQTVAGREVARFRFDASALAGIGSGTQLLMIVRSEGSSRGGTREFNVLVSRRAQPGGSAGHP